MSRFTVHQKRGGRTFVATEPLAGFRKLTVENDHKLATWVLFMANLTDTIYENATIDRREIIHNPAHGSWLNMAEIEFSVFTRQELNRPFADKKQVEIVAAK